MASTTTGVLLINLGTPDAPTTGAVRRYLRQFLADERVLDIALPLRWLLLHLVILPRRPARSAAAYRSIWKDGSPLLLAGNALTRKLRDRFKGVPVELGMRYGSPSMERACERLRDQGCDRWVVLPLYPQYASSSTGSSLQLVYRHAARLWNVPALDVVPPFYDHTAFLDAFAAVAKPELDQFQPDFVLFSYHGLPERQVRKSDESGTYCFSFDGCCEAISRANQHCYRAQCFATTRGLKQRLQLADDHISTSFQSRLGRSPWIQPFTDQVIPELAKRRVGKLAVFCPSFVADCLETFEEIGIRAAHDFEQAGGTELRLIPSLNAEDVWVDALVSLIGRHLKPNILDAGETA